MNQVFLTRMRRLNNARDAKKLVWIDESLSELISLWQPTITDCIPRAVVVSLNSRDSDGDLANVLRHQLTGELHLWNCFPRTLSEGTLEPSFALQRFGPLPREDSFTALWRFACLCTNDWMFRPSNLRLAAIESVLEALSVSDSNFAHISHSIIALLKILIFKELDSFKGSTLGEVRINHNAFPAATATKLPDEFLAMNENDEISASQAETLYVFRHWRISEATIDVIAQYLENCASKVQPYENLRTLEKIARYVPASLPIHPIHQIRLANSIHAVFVPEQSIELLDGIINSKCWFLYAEGHKTPELQDTINLIGKSVDFSAPFGEHLARNRLLAPKQIGRDLRSSQSLR
ncbi:hypothetical protein B0H19DRAFT_1068424 [Mycena capillaripes]|nr:hypothetical protein B0H19DRAFT_1068424 [Mycena capillaripes]